jgi:hypothetical protein
MIIDRVEKFLRVHSISACSLLDIPCVERLVRRGNSNSSAQGDFELLVACAETQLDAECLARGHESPVRRGSFRKCRAIAQRLPWAMIGATA